MLSDFDLTGRRALVTGAGRGIGKGIALALAEAGADVGVTALGETNAHIVAEAVQRIGRRGFGWAADGTRVEPMQAVAEQALREMGGLDILVNCIGDAIRGAVSTNPAEPQQKTLTEQDWHTVVDINLTQAFVGCHVFGPHFLGQGHGVVLNVSGFAAVRASPMMSAYAAAKTALTRFTECIALEWAPRRVRVNAIAPGTFPDRETISEQDFLRREQQAASTIPLARFGQTREVGLLAVYLSSPAAAYITGQTIAIDGGRTLVG
ncbi:MAG TPA: SDR family oxidoreductase [Chloroflexota bacterium]|jgi:NAD(P)-dependent dehydrogenase (short-subunit alcohol dehydrogenase family)